MTRQVDVLIAGGGPCGLVLAIELGRRGVRVLLVNDQLETAFNPQANATQARTMEHFRRLGFADEIRALGLPPDYPTDIAYCTRYIGFELARFKLPSAKDAKKAVTQLNGAWSAAELPHRVSQKFVEKCLYQKASELPSVELCYGTRLRHFEDVGDHVTATIEDLQSGGIEAVSAGYLVGADGPRSMVRQQMGWRYEGEGGIPRDFMGGRMYAIYLRAPTFYERCPHPPAWMNVTFNTERRAFMAAVDGVQEFAFHTQLKPGEDESTLTDADAKALFYEAVGAEIPIEILARRGWTAGHCLVASEFQQARVFIAGDAAHLFTPTGGLGYNTAVEDAVNLGWKLAAVLKGYAAESVLETYGLERKPAAVRNTNYARGFADSLGLFVPDPSIEATDPTGEEVRAIAGAYLEAHGRAEFNIPGVTFGTRYDASPLVLSTGESPPPDQANHYEQTAIPGGRAPHLWLPDGTSIYDHFGFDWTLIHFGLSQDTLASWSEQAASRGLPLSLYRSDSTEAEALYGADWVLIRPDQVVAARGTRDASSAHLLSYLLGQV